MVPGKLKLSDRIANRQHFRRPKSISKKVELAREPSKSKEVELTQEPLIKNRRGLLGLYSDYCATLRYLYRRYLYRRYLYRRYLFRKGLLRLLGLYSDYFVTLRYLSYSPKFEKYKIIQVCGKLLVFVLNLITIILKRVFNLARRLINLLIRVIILVINLPIRVIILVINLPIMVVSFTRRVITQVANFYKINVGIFSDLPEPKIEYMLGDDRKPRTVWILSYTPVYNEPRVLRQAAAFRDMNWRVVVAGYEGHSPRPAYWHFICLPDSLPHLKPIVRYCVFFIRGLSLFLAKFGAMVWTKQLGARVYHKINLGNFWWRVLIRDFARSHYNLRPDLIISHDYMTADVGYECSQWFDSGFAIDVHEYARGQYMHDKRWVRFMRPYVRHFQDYYLAKADCVTTVCEGIAELLNKEQILKREARVVRSVPFLSNQAFRSCEEEITIIYVGDISYMRGLHKAIKSMPYWREEFRFVMMGNVDDTYRENLISLSNELGVASRVNILRPVAFDEIVPCANRIADIGYFVHKDTSPQKKFTLPNKFFEYMMAGLALCVSDLPEMSRLVKQYEVGKLVPDYDIRAIADAVNSFDRESINQMKKNSLEAAKELNWDVEQKHMLSLYENLIT